MYLLVSYDIETTTKEGAKALSKIGKLMKGFGIRVQNSLWECLLAPHEVMELEGELKVLMKGLKGNIRIYQLPRNWKSKTTQVIGRPPNNLVDPIII